MEIAGNKDVRGSTKSSNDIESIADTLRKYVGKCILNDVLKRRRGNVIVRWFKSRWYRYYLNTNMSIEITKNRYYTNDENTRKLNVECYVCAKHDVSVIKCRRIGLRPLSVVFITPNELCEILRESDSAFKKYNDNIVMYRYSVIT